MLRFEHPYFLYALALVPILLVLQFMLNKWRKKVLNTLGSTRIINTMLPNVSIAKFRLKGVFFILSIASLVIAMANPQIGSKLEEVKAEGIEIMIALDLSNSMLAEDVAPNRLNAAKQSISRFIDQLKNDKIGIVVFAGEAYTQLPITSDYAAAKLFLSTINTNIVPTQGTAIGSAIDLCAEAFNYENPVGKTILVITDGENHEDDAKEAAARANQNGVIVHTIGIGSESGAPIPVYKNGVKQGFRKSKSGETVVTILNPSMLAEVAAAGGGQSLIVQNSSASLNAILSSINTMQKAELGSKVFTDYEDRFQLFIALACVLLLIELAIPTTKTHWWHKLIQSDSNE